MTTDVFLGGLATLILAAIVIVMLTMDTGAAQEKKGKRDKRSGKDHSFK